MTTFAASVTIIDLPVAQAISGAELFEAVQTVASVGQSVQVPLNRMLYPNSIGSTQLGLFAVQQTNIALGAVGTAQLATGIINPLTLTKATPLAAAPGAGFCVIQAVAGTNPGTCKIIIYAGTSTTAITIVDNVGSGF